jgi:hypothetical protein
VHGHGTDGSLVNWCLSGLEPRCDDAEHLFATCAIFLRVARCARRCAVHRLGLWNLCTAM